MMLVLYKCFTSLTESFTVVDERCVACTTAVLTDGVFVFVTVCSVDDETEQIGVLGVTVECLQTLQAINREL